MPDAAPLTPLLAIDRETFVKCEFLHPGRSHKARVARALVDDAEQRELIHPGDGPVLLERTGGNLGIALAVEAQARGYELTLVTDPHYSVAKRQLAAKLGAQVIDRRKEFPQCTTNGEAVQALLNAEPAKYHYLNQFANPANPEAHERGTGAEILAQLLTRGFGRRATPVLVLGMGTGASMRGISNVMRRWFQQVITLGVEPHNCDLLAKRYEDHSLQGIAVGEPAPFYGVEDLDGIVKVDDHAVAIAHDELLRNHRFLVGPSSAANFSAVKRAQEHPAIEKAKDPFYVTLLYDRGEDYV